MDPEQKRCTGYNDNPANGSSPARIGITASRPLPAAGTPHTPVPAGPPPACTAPPYLLTCAMPPHHHLMQWTPPRAGTAAVVLPDLHGPRCTQQPSPHSPLACPGPSTRQRCANRPGQWPVNAAITVESSASRQPGTGNGHGPPPPTVTMPCTPPAPTLPRPRCRRPRPVGWRAASIATRRRGQQHPTPARLLPHPCRCAACNTPSAGLQCRCTATQAPGPWSLFCFCHCTSPIRVRSLFPDDL